MTDDRMQLFASRVGDSASGRETWSIRNTDDEVTRVQQGKILKYPLDLGHESSDAQNFIIFKIFSHVNRKSFHEVSDYVALHIPTGALKTAYKQNFETLSGGRVFEEEGGQMLAAGVTGAAIASLLKSTKGAAVLGAAAAAAAAAAIGTPGTGISIDRIIGTAISQGGGAIAAAGILGANALADTQMGKTFSAMTGVAINPHTSLIYRGPTGFRQHDLVFDFWPRSKEEAKVVSQISKLFRKKMLPDVDNAFGMRSLIFKHPHHFKIKFYVHTQEKKAEEFKQMTIKRSVLKDLTFDYDAAQGPAFYEQHDKDDGPFPVHTRMSCSFQETEFIVNYPVGMGKLENGEWKYNQ